MRKITKRGKTGRTATHTFNNGVSNNKYPAIIYIGTIQDGFPLLDARCSWLSFMLYFYCCCQACPSCPASAIQMAMGCVTWAVWVSIKKYTLSLLQMHKREWHQKDLLWLRISTFTSLFASGLKPISQPWMHACECACCFE